MDENVRFTLAFQDDASGIEEAIRAGADPNVLHPRGRHTSLQVAAQAGSMQALDALLSGGADPNRRFTWVSRVDGRVLPSRVALMYAASDSVVRSLVSAGADVNATDQSGWTPLACAIEKVNSEAFRALLDMGARVDVRVVLDGRSTSLIDLAEAKAARITEVAGEQPNPKAVRMIEALAAMRSDLLRAGASSRK